MRKILIGVVETGTPKVRLYADAFTELGARVDVLDWRQARDPQADAAYYDALVLCGGDDVEASYFGEENHPSVVLDPPERDAYELELARVAVQRGVPLLAVCRGVQVLNVALGGTVDQHIPATPGRQEHAGGVIHTVTVAHDSILQRILRALRPASDDCTAVRVNSFHHQAVGEVAPGLRVTAITADGVIEAIEGDPAADRGSANGPAFCLGVQWHPERSEGDPELRFPIFEALFEAAALRPAENRRESGTSGPIRPS